MRVRDSAQLQRLARPCLAAEVVARSAVPSMRSLGNGLAHLVASRVVPRLTASPDFAILTALEEERDAVLREFPGAERVDGDAASAGVYHAAEVPTASGRRSRVVITCLGGMGPVLAAVRASEIARRFAPRGVLMVGIAGGVRGKVSIGDVLVASQIADSTVAKVEAEGRAVRWQSYPADAILLGAAVDLAAGWQDLLHVSRPSPGLPRRHVGIVVSGGDVIADARVVSAYLARWPKLIGVEMEGAGIAAALHAAPSRPRLLMVRGVSDLADSEKDASGTKEWREYACHVAAAYTVALLRTDPLPSPTSLEKTLVAELKKSFSTTQLDDLIRLHFPRISGGLADIVSPLYDRGHQIVQLVTYFKSRDALDALDQAVRDFAAATLDELRPDE